MNYLGYSQLSNPNQSPKLVLMSKEIIKNTFVTRYFYYLCKGFHYIVFIDLIYSNTE